MDEERQPARAARWPWLIEGARVLALRAPRWERLHARPATVATLVLASYAVAALMERLWEDDGAQLVWTTFLSGWVGVALMAWLCWVVARAAGAKAPAGTVLALSSAAGIVLNVVMTAGMLGLVKAAGPADEWSYPARWAAWLLPLVWAGLMQMVLLCRASGPSPARLAALLLVPVPLVLNNWLAPASFWWTPPAESAAGHHRLKLTDEVLAAQQTLLGDALAALHPREADRVNVYGATYAPYASEDVFMRESAVVAKTMRERFATEGRFVELVVNPGTATTLPWATPSHLRRTIQHMAAAMDREHDVLFLHLTSHGGADGHLASQAFPLEMEPLTPQLLKAWLDEAGIKWRVISISACYSGSWIEPLASDGTLVMTAADATHTSYGCGRRSELTFFGRAMYVDALHQTRSFEAAHAQARELIRTREVEAGKSDGYSNPQIRMGKDIQAVLKRLEEDQGR